MIGMLYPAIIKEEPGSWKKKDHMLQLASTAFNIVPPLPKVKDVWLNNQHDAMQAIIWAGIAQMTKHVFQWDSGVKANEWMTYCTNFIKDACDKVKKQYPGAKEVQKCVKVLNTTKLCIA